MNTSEEVARLEAICLICIVNWGAFGSELNADKIGWGSNWSVEGANKTESMHGVLK